MSDKLPMMIALRGYAVPVRDDDDADKSKNAKPDRRQRKALAKPSNETVVFDTETGTDQAQTLRIGTYQVHKGMELFEKGAFYQPGNIAPSELELLKAYTEKYRLVLRTREEFVREVLYLYGYDHGGLILGFNLPFDLSRLALSITTSHGKDMRGGFTLELLPEKWLPNSLIKHLNSRSAFMRFAAAPGPVDGRGMRRRMFKTQAKTGYFQDVKTLAAALLGQSHSLGSLAALLGTAHQKIETDEHGGPLTSEYIDYAVNDTDVTWDCYVELIRQYAAHGLKDTPPHRIYSEASLGKAYLRQMGIERWTKLQPEFSPETLGIIMSTYYGGRAEVRIRREMTRVLYCDFRSMYPSVCTLMQIWPFVIAQGVEQEEWVDEARMLLARVELADLRRQNLWKFLTTLVQVAPDEDILPVRTRYGEDSRTIGLNYNSADFGLWYTLADCISSKLLTGKSPKILRAIRFTPKEPQTGLQSIAIGGNSEFLIDPLRDDLYKRIIELRGQVQSDEKRARAEGRLKDAERLSSYQLMLKLLANSTSYGIFAELNVQSYDRPRQVICHGGEGAEFETGTKSIEESGTHFHPLLATLITGAARLMLAIAERVAADSDIGWAFCDTDSLALACPAGMTEKSFLERAVAVTKWFDPLNPYGDGKPLFKIEDQNFRLENGEIIAGKHEPLYAIAISAKRYVLFDLTDDKRPIIRKALAHGLGHWLPPYKECDAPQTIPLPSLKLTDIGADRWHYDLWYQIILAELHGHPDQVDLSQLPGLDKPAASRYSASTSTLLHWFDSFNAGKAIGKRVKAFNFLLAFQVSRTALYAAIATGTIDSAVMDDGLPAVVAPYDSDPFRAAANCFNRRTGRPVPLSILATYREVLADYHLHAESKFGNAETTDRGITERRHIQTVAVEYIGKEANRWEEQFHLGEMPDAQIEYGPSVEGKERVIKLIAHAGRTLGVAALAAEAGLSRQQLSAVLALHAEPRLQTIRELLRAIVTLDAERLQRDAAAEAQIERLRGRVLRTSIAEFAQEVGCDASNLAKVLNGSRRMSSDLATRIRRRLPRFRL